MKKTIFMIFFFLILFLNFKEYSKLISLLRNSKNYFNIILYDNIINDDVNPEGMINNDGLGNLICDTGMGFATCEIIKLIEKGNEVILTIKSGKCTKFKETEDFPECLLWEEKVIEYVLTKEIINKLVSVKDIDYEIKGKLISRNIKKNMSPK